MIIQNIISRITGRVFDSFQRYCIAVKIFRQSDIKSLSIYPGFRRNRFKGIFTKTFNPLKSVLINCIPCIIILKLPGINFIKKEFILTGSHIPLNNVFELADLVSEIKKVKHPYDSGIMARKGLDY